MAAVLLLSGGMDSTTCLWWMREQGVADIHAVTVDYGQRHRVELEYAAAVARRIRVTAHKIIRLDLTSIGGSPLTDGALDVPAAAEDRQAITVVPFRNMLFATAAAAYAETAGIHDLYLAPVRDDYQAYRDCRREFYDGLERALQLGATANTAFNLHTPFVARWKSEVIAIGLELGVPYADTHTCYEGRRPACGRCDACTERLQAFAANGAADPLTYEEKDPSA